MFGVILSTVIACVPPSFDTRPLLHAMYAVESGGGKVLVGDGGKAIGPYQIWETYWRDAVQHDPSIGGVYADCMGKEYSERVIAAYWSRYAPRGATAEQLARIHNGGCGILKRKGTKAWHNTTAYWNKIRKAMGE